MAQCHHGICYDIVNHPLRNMKLDQHLVLIGSFFVVWFSDYVRDVYAKQTSKEIAAEGNCQQFFRVRYYDHLEGHEGRRFSATKMNSENRQQEVERVAESKIVLNRHVFVSIFG